MKPPRRTPRPPVSALAALLLGALAPAPGLGCPTDDLVRRGMEILGVTSNEVCKLYDNIDSSIDGVQQRMKDTASMDEAKRQYKAVGAIDDTVRGYFMDDATVEVSSARTRRIRPYGARNYFLHLARLGEANNYVEVSVEYLKDYTRYGYPVLVDSQTVALEATAYSVYEGAGDFRYRDLTEKRYVFQANLLNGHLRDVRIKEIVVINTYGEEHFKLEGGQLSLKKPIQMTR